MVFTEKELNKIKQCKKQEELIKQQEEMKKTVDREIFVDGVMTSLELFMESMKKYDELVKLYKKRKIETGKLVTRLFRKHVSVYATGLREWDGPDWLYVAAGGAFYTGHTDAENPLYWLKPFEYEKQAFKIAYVNKKWWDVRCGKLPGAYNSLFLQMVRCTYETKRVYMDGCEECHLLSTEMLSKAEIERNIKLLVIECAGGYTARQKAEKTLALVETSAKTGRTTNNSTDKESEISFINTNERDDIEKISNKGKLARMGINELMKYEPQNEEERIIMIKLLKEHMEKTYGKR